MSTNKDLATQLAAMRTKAKQAAATAEPVTQSEPAPLKPQEEEQPKANDPAAAAPKLKVLTSSRKPQQSKQEGRGEQKHKPTGELERTTITLKAGDTEALSDLQSFLMKRKRKAASTSTLIRLALSYTKQALSSDAETLAKTYYQIIAEDGRKKPDNV